MSVIKYTPKLNVNCYVQPWKQKEDNKGKKEVIYDYKVWSMLDQHEIKHYNGNRLFSHNFSSWYITDLILIK